MKTYAEAYCKACKERATLHAFGTFGSTYCETPQPPALLRWLEKHAGCPPLTLCTEDHHHEAVWEEIGYPVTRANLPTLFEPALDYFGKPIVFKDDGLDGAPDDP